MAIGNHPRIWLSPTVLTRAKGRVNSNHAYWQACKSLADRTPGSDFDLYNCALAYALTGQSAYADRTIALMQSLANKPVTAIDRDSGYDARSLLPAMAVGFDWCYPRLSVSQRSAFAAKMVAWAERIWPETGGTLSTKWGGWPQSNYMHGFQQCWLVGIALTEEGANAERLMSQAVARHKSKTMPWMSSIKGGYPEEGTGYGMSGSYLWMAHYLTGHLTATGDAPTTIMPADWYPSLLRAFIHLTTPNLRRLYPGGDQARVSTAPISDYSLAAVLSMMDYLPAEDAGMARYWYEQVAPSRDKIGWTNWMPLLWYRDDVPATPGSSWRGTAYSMPGMGVMSARSDWQADAVQVVAVGGPVIENAHQDQTGSFMLWRGTEWLAGCQKVWSSDGGLHNAKELNVVTIDDKNQPAKTSCRVLFSQDTPAATQWAADLTQAYPSDLNEWRRDLLFVRPNWLVVLDRVNTKNAGAAKRWLLHVKDAPTLGSRTYAASAGGSTLYGTSLLPVGAAITQERMSTGSYRLNIKSPGGKGLEHFLQVLEAVPSGQVATLVTVSGVNGLTLRLGQIAVECALDATGEPALRLAVGTPPPPGNQPPVANAGGPYVGTVNQAIMFNGIHSNDSDGTITEYRWDFGDGVTVLAVAPKHSFQVSGIYSVALTVTDNKGATATATTIATITAEPPPPARMRVTIATTPSPTGVLFDGAVIAGAPLPIGSVISVNVSKPDGSQAEAQVIIQGNTPPPPPSGPIYRGAEGALLTAPMTRRTVAGASGGVAVGTDSANAGSATFSVSIVTAGTYHLWARVIARDGNSDSFLVSWGVGEDVFDCGEEQWSASWQWVRLNGRGTSGTPASVNPRTLVLSAGTYLIRFAGREPGTLLDRIALTTDAAFRPE